MTTDHDAGPSHAELIEELHRAEAQISALGDQYRTLFARAPVAMLTVGDDGVIRQANDAARTLLTAGEPLDAKPLDLHVAPDDHAALRGLVRYRDGSAQTEAVFRDRLGTRIPCHVTALHLSGLQDEADTVLLSLDDRREQDRLATVLAEAERSKAIRQLTGGIAHDFNNLLTVIVGNLSLLEDEVDSDDGRRWLTAARTAGDRGGRLVAQLLTYARSHSLVAQPCEPFYTTKSLASSSGLGLAMVASFVQASHGELVMHTAPASGTTIILTLPAVHDDLGPAVREVTAALLEARGARVVAMADAERALARLVGHQVDVMLSDVVLGALGAALAGDGGPA